MLNSEKQLKLLIDNFKELCSNYSFLKSNYLYNIEKLEQKLSQPCVLAIAGRVKAGKSSFLNALLGEDLAKIGDTETTATINYFKGGKPLDPTHPIKVVWESGNETYVDKSFMDSLQGRDDETLKRAQGIKWLEYYIDIPELREITLVDTPGTDAIVGSETVSHENVTREYFQLRNKHSKQTTECTTNADAVIYLVGPVPTKSGLSFLSEFQSAAGTSSAINSIGIMTKVDVDKTLLDKRKEQAQYVANGLKDQLNTVIPVSASIYNALKDNRDKFAEWKQELSEIPSEAFEYLMSSEECFYESDEEIICALYEGTGKSPISLSNRKEMRGELMWSVFRTIACSLYYNEKVDDSISELEDIAGIDHVWDVLNNTFFIRAKNIKCYNATIGLERLLFDLLHGELRTMRERCIMQSKAQSYIKGCRDSHVRQLLEDAISQYIVPLNDIEKIDKEILIIQRDIENLHLSLERDDRNFTMLHILEKEKTSFTDYEYDELCVLFGLYEGDLLSNIGVRQNYWNYISNCAANRNIQQIAEYAVELYSNHI